MAAMAANRWLSPRIFETNETRRLEGKEGGDGQVTVSGVDSVRVRVHHYERCFRRKPDRRVPPDEVRAGPSQDTGGTLGGVTDGARFRRTTATCIRGVSDPLRTGRGAKKGDRFEPVTRQPVDPGWRQVHVHEQLHG
jgi:hypothetical protein